MNKLNKFSVGDVVSYSLTGSTGIVAAVEPEILFLNWDWGQSGYVIGVQRISELLLRSASANDAAHAALKTALKTA